MPPAVLECYREFIAEAPEQLGCFFGWQIAPAAAVHSRGPGRGSVLRTGHVLERPT